MESAAASTRRRGEIRQHLFFMKLDYLATASKLLRFSPSCPFDVESICECGNTSSDPSAQQRTMAR